MSQHAILSYIAQSHLGVSVATRVLSQHVFQLADGTDKGIDKEIRHLLRLPLLVNEVRWQRWGQ